jgi:hypothetical protein
MRAKYLFIISGLLLITAFGLLAAGWNGTVNVSFAWPINASSFKFAGEATGGWAVGGMLSAIAAIVVFLTASVRAVLHLGADRDDVDSNLARGASSRS